MVSLSILNSCGVIAHFHLLSMLILTSCHPQLLSMLILVSISFSSFFSALARDHFCPCLTPFVFLVHCHLFGLLFIVVVHSILVFVVILVWYRFSSSFCVLAQRYLISLLNFIFSLSSSPFRFYSHLHILSLLILILRLVHRVLPFLILISCRCQPSIVVLHFIILVLWPCSS